MTSRVTMLRTLPLTLLLCGFGAAFAQTAPPPPSAPAPPAPPPAAAPGADDAEIDERVEAARARLDAAARELAELTMDADGPVRRQIRIIGPARPQAIIGVQLDTDASSDGAKVQRVSPGGAAAEAGILAGDVITEVDGRSLKGVDQGARALIEYMRRHADTLCTPAGTCRMGPAVTISDLRESEIINKYIPHFHKFSKLVSSTPIRNMATVAGNFVNASPIGDFSIFFLALDASITLKQKSEERTLPLRDFYKGYKQLNKEPDEYISGISFKLPKENSFFNFVKFRFFFFDSSYLKLGLSKIF